MKQKIYVVGIGPGAPKMMTPQARQALEESDVIAGYQVYLKLLGDLVQNKKTIATPMTREEERCRLCFEEAKKGCIASIVCSGDSGVYGMASLMYDLLPEYPGCELEIIPGITAAVSGAAVLGAPIGHDFCVIRGCSGNILNVATDYLNGKIADSGIGCSSHEHHQCHNHNE